jgi:hypothetical protein
MKKIISIVVLIAVAAVIVVFLKKETSPDYKNATYMIEGKSVTLVNGKAETESMQDSAIKVVTTYFGNLAKGDLNGDSVPDLAFIITQNTGGTGTFYYVVAALQNKNGGYVGSNAFFLGDRIAPQTTEIKDGTLIVNYAVHKVGEPMTAAPSVGVSEYIKVDGTSLMEIPK